MAILFWIEFWRIGRQVFHMNFRMLLQKRLHDFGFMGPRLIPDQDERAFDVAHQVFQSDQQFFGIERAIKMSFVDLARNRQADQRRCFPWKAGRHCAFFQLLDQRLFGSLIQFRRSACSFSQLQSLGSPFGKLSLPLANGCFSNTQRSLI